VLHALLGQRRRCEACQGAARRPRQDGEREELSCKRLGFDRAGSPAQRPGTVPRRKTRSGRDEKSHDAGCRNGELAGDRAGAGRALASAILLLRSKPGRRSGDDEGEICLHRRPAAAGRLSRYEPGTRRLERLFALRGDDLYLRLFGDGHGGRSRAGTGGNPRSSQSLSRGGLDRGRRAIVSQLRRFARRRAPGFDHAEHRSNRRQEICRSSHRFRPQELGAGMTVSSVVLLDRAADHAPALMQVAGLCKRYGEQRALADISFAVNAGEVLGLIGPNGAGKTTLMEAVAGVLAADDGRILWRGTPVALPQRREFMFYLPDGLRPWEDQYV